MKRLTTKRDWEEASKDLKHELGYSYIWKRLNEIEDILGDEYDINRLRELLEADRNGRCVILPTNIYTNEDAKKALEKAMFSLKIADTATNRFTVQAVTEKIIEEGYDESIWGRNK